MTTLAEKITISYASPGVPNGYVAEHWFIFSKQAVGWVRCSGVGSVVDDGDGGFTKTFDMVLTEGDILYLLQTTSVKSNSTVQKVYTFYKYTGGALVVLYPSQTDWKIGAFYLQGTEYFTMDVKSDVGVAGSGPVEDALVLAYLGLR